MGIKRLNDGSGFEVECFTCGEIQEFQVGSNWDELLSEMYLCGWRFTRTDGDWNHYCPLCVEKYRERNDKTKI
jgi:hypothetical protein